MSELHSYPKVYAIGHAAIPDLFDGDVLVEEKVDGSQYNFGIIGGELVMKSRGAGLHATNPEKMFAQAIHSAQELAPRLREGWVYRAEVLCKPKHNVLAYSRIPRHGFILFDVTTGDEVYLSRADKEAEAERLGLEIVPVMYEGKVSSPDQIYSFLERDSVLGEAKVEGVVVKNYSRFGRDKKVLMGKFVREDFKEKHAKEWKASNPAMSDVIERLCAEMRNEVRWQKAIFRLRDEGKIEGSPRDIGILLKEIQSDVKAEESDYIAKKLAEYAIPRILRASTAGFPEWYKDRLLQSAFTEVSQ